MRLRSESVSYFGRRSSLPFLVAGIALVWVNLVVIGPPPDQVRSGANDFLSFYSGGRLAGSPELYQPPAVKRVQAALGFDGGLLSFIRLPFYAAVLAPFSLLPYQTAYAVWQLLNLLAVVAFVFLFTGAPRSVTALATAGSYPLLSAFWNGQDVALVLLALGIAHRLFGRNNHWAAGFVLSACLIKFHLFLTLPLWIWRRRLWRLGAGLAAGALVLLSLCFVFQGPGWVGAYWDVLRLPSISSGESLMPNVHGLVYSWRYGVLVEVLAAVIVLGLVWWRTPHLSFNASLSLTLAAGLLLSHHAYAADAVILLVAALFGLDAGSRLVVRVCSALLLFPPVYVLLKFPASASAAAKAAIVVFLVAVALDRSRGSSPVAPAPSSHDAPKPERALLEPLCRPVIPAERF